MSLNYKKQLHQSLYSRQLTTGYIKLLEQDNQHQSRWNNQNMQHPQYHNTYQFPNQTPPLQPNKLTMVFQNDEENNITQMENINKCIYNRDMDDKEEWDQICYTQELRTHFYRAKQLLNHQQYTQNEHNVQIMHRKHRRGVSMDLNELNKKNSISQTVPIRCNKKPKNEVIKKQLKNEKNGKKKSVINRKSQNASKIVTKIHKKQALKTLDKQFSKNKHSRWVSDFTTRNRQSQINLTDPNNNDKKHKKSHNINKSGHRKPNKKNEYDDKIIKLANNSKITSLKSLDYANLESTQNQMNFQAFSMNLNGKNTIHYEYPLNFSKQLQPTKQQEAEVMQISQDINKFSTKLSSIPLQTEDTTIIGDKYGQTKQLVADYIVKIQQLQQKLIDDEKRFIQINAQNSIQSFDASPIPSQSINESEVIERIQGPIHKNRIMSKITQILIQINRIKQSKNNGEQNYQKKQQESIQSNNSFKYEQQINVPQFLGRLDEDGAAIEENFIKQLLKLQQKFQNGRIQQKQYGKQIKNLNKWRELKIRNISKAKLMLKNGYKLAIQTIQTKPSLSNKSRVSNNYETQKPQKKLIKKNPLNLNKTLSKSMAYLKYQNYTYNNNKLKQQNGQQQPFIKLKQIQQLSNNNDQKNTIDQADLPNLDDYQHSIQQYQQPINQTTQQQQLINQLLPLNSSSKQEQSISNNQQPNLVKLENQQLQPNIYPITNYQSNINIDSGDIGGPLSPPPKLQISASKQLTLQQKQDIIQFLFMDICLQLQEYYVRNILPSIQTQSSQIHTKSLLRTRLKNALNPQKRKKGFNTNRKQLLQLLQTFKKYLKGQYNQNGIQIPSEITNSQKQCFARTIQYNLNIPVGPSPEQLLKFMRVYNQDSSHQQQQNYEHLPIQQPNNNEQSQQITYVLPIQWFDQFSKYYINSYDFSRYYIDQQKQQKRTIYLKNAMHIHNKAIFDNLNQAADKYRKFGLFGEPFPWKLPPFLHSSAGVHKFGPINLNQTMDNIFKQVQENSIYLCGIMHDKQFTYNISEYEAAQLRQDRLCKMLAKDLVESEPRWLFYDDQQTQIMVDIAEWMYGYLLGQSVRQLASLKSSNNNI